MLNETKNRVNQSIALFAPLGAIRCRTQFGGFSLSSDNAMFAVVSEGDLYIRAAFDNDTIMKQLNMQQFIYRKRGIDILLRYFKVNDALWQQPEKIIALADEAIRGVQSERKARKTDPKRLKDLPNFNLSMERMLWQIGVKDSAELRIQGSIRTYVKLCSVNKGTGLSMLFALEGAILGFHKSVLPEHTRHKLIHWFNIFEQERGSKELVR